MSDKPIVSPSWYDGLSDELKGHVQNRGLHTKTAEEAARQLAQDHRETQQKLGIPPERVLRLPEKDDDPAWAGVYERLGAPKEPSEYKFDAVKFKDGTPLPEEFTNSIRATAAELHLPLPAAQKLAERLVAFVDADEARDSATRAAAVGAAQTALRQSWGRDYDLNMFKTTKVVEALGWDASTIDQLQTAVGTDKLLTGLLGLANKMSEADLLRGGGTINGGGSMTREQAITRKATLMTDRAWGAKFVNGDSDAMREMDNLNRIIVGPPPR